MNRLRAEEMLRAERNVDPDAIRQEVEVYNELLPGADELSATLMIAQAPLDGARRASLLRDLEPEDAPSLLVG